MKLFIFDSVKKLTDSYHSRGGAAVIAESREAAVAMLTAPTECFTPVVEEDEAAAAIEFELCGNHEPKVFIFPDAGCC